MVQPDGRIRLLDFGLSRQLDEGSTLTAEGLLLGTPAYMAPELIGGDRGGPQSDLYSLGVLAYWLASGSVPFPGKNPV
jgi:serine/threonine-protein kinase